jgi:hypothetical protein
LDRLLFLGIHGLMQIESRPLLSNLVSSPLQFQDHIRRLVSFLFKDAF